MSKRKIEPHWLVKYAISHNNMFRLHFGHGEGKSFSKKRPHLHLACHHEERCLFQSPPPPRHRCHSAVAGKQLGRTEPPLCHANSSWKPTEGTFASCAEEKKLPCVCRDDFLSNLNVASKSSLNSQVNWSDIFNSGPLALLDGANYTACGHLIKKDLMGCYKG